MRKTKKWIGLSLCNLLLASTLVGCSDTSSQDTSKESTTAKTSTATKDENVKTVVFVQDTDTANGLNFTDPVTEALEVETTLEDDGIASRIYKPSSGETLIVTFHGNGEGGTEDGSNNYSQIAANRQVATMISQEVQEGFGGAYVLSFQTPDDWYTDHTEEVKKVIDEVVKEYNINPDRIFATGLSAGGLMTERMIGTYPELFAGALISCPAIAKNDTYVEGSAVLPTLGGDYSAEDYIIYPDANDKELEGIADDKSLDAGDEKTGFKTEDGTAYAKFKKPADYEEYVKNYDKWIEAIAKSNVPIYIVHSYTDPTIYYTWTEKAGTGISEYRQANNLDGEIRYEIIDSTDPWPGHWAWVKMYNNDITNDGTTTIDWFTSLVEPTEGFTYSAPKESDEHSTTQDGQVEYTLEAEVLDDGEKITKIHLAPLDDSIDVSKLTPELFKVTRTNYGESEEVEVTEITVDGDNCVILTLEPEGVLHYNGKRNIVEPIVYTIEEADLPTKESK